MSIFFLSNKRELQGKIKEQEYARLSIETKRKLVKSDDLMINKLVLNFITIKSDLLEKLTTLFFLKLYIIMNVLVIILFLTEEHNKLTFFIL